MDMAARRGKTFRKPLDGATELPIKSLQAIDRSLLSWVFRELHHKAQHDASRRPTENQQRRVVSPTNIIRRVTKSLLSLKSAHTKPSNISDSSPYISKNSMINIYNSPCMFIALFWAFTYCIPSHIRTLLFQTLFHVLFNRYTLLELPIFFIVFSSLSILAFCLFLNLDLAKGLDINNFRRRPKIFLTYTSHRRFFPVRHNFSWPILYVGIPANFKGNIGRLFSVKEAKEAGGRGESKWSVFSLDPKHYSNPELPWEEKFSHKLREAGHDPTEYSDIYIVTTPKFLGYSFNPVSYFLYYRLSGELGAVVLEVKNTFKEQHVYVLSRKHAAEWNAANCAPSNKKWTVKLQSGFTLADRHPKEFHISPFNHRSGVYEFQVLDPSERDQVHVRMSVIDVTGRKMMTALVKTSEQGIDMFTMERKTALYMIFMWGATQFMAIPRTFYEALRIFRKRMTRVYQRPEVSPSSGARPETDIERFSRIKFLQYLKAMVSASSTPLKLSIQLPNSDPASENKQVHFTSDHSASVGDLKEYKPLSLVVLSPAFFSRQLALDNQRLAYLADVGMQLKERGTAFATEEDWKILMNLLDNKSNISTPKSQSEDQWRYKVIEAITRPTIQPLLCLTIFARNFYTWTEGYPLARARRNGMDIYFENDTEYKLLVAMVAKDSLFWWFWKVCMTMLTHCGLDMSWTT